MSLLPTGSYANPTQPLWTPFGGGGGGGRNFSTLNINPNGNLNITTDSNFDGGALNFARTSDGSTFTQLQMLWEPGTSNPPSNPALLSLSLVAENGDYDNLVAGSVGVVGPSPYSFATDNALTLGGSPLGMRYGPSATPAFTLFTVNSSNTWDAERLNTINGKQLAQAGVDTTSGSAATVGLPSSYVDDQYAVVVTPFSSDAVWVTSNTPSNFEVNTMGSNVRFSWITMPYT
jgi:hypothetical protein